MAARTLSAALTICCIFSGTCFALAADPAGKDPAATPDTPSAVDAAGKPAKPQPAKIRLQAAGAQKVGDAAGFSMTVEVSNPNQKGSLTFVGYKPDSFDPPLPKGQISPIYKVELKRAGKWQKRPIGWCGTGMGAIALEPQATATFGVWVPEGDWEAVRVGVTWTTVAFENAGAKPDDFTTEWSNELTHKGAQQVK
jgi:hypothetical protein